MIVIVTGLLDSDAGSFYLGGAGFLILFYSIRTYLKLNKSNTLDDNKLNGFEKFCGYIGLFNGFIFLAIGAILFIVSIVKLKLPTFGEIVVEIVALIYGYSIIYYVRKTLKKFN
jgi:hypothetical protein